MKTRYKYLFSLLIFLLLAAVFTFLREPVAAAVNAALIAAGEGRSIRVDNTDMVKRKPVGQVKVRGGSKIAGAAQVKVFPGKLAAPPVTRMTEGDPKAKRGKAMFIREWAVLGEFGFGAIAGQLNRQILLAQECMNGETANVSFENVPKGYEWNRLQNLSSDGRVDLTETFRKNRKAAGAWLAADLEFEREYPDAVMLAGIQQAGRIFLNGKLIFTSTAKTPARVDGTRMKVHLKPGVNRIVVKAATANAKSWLVYLRFITADKKPLMPKTEKKTGAARPAGSGTR